jgi:hypothetical protein
LFVLCLHCGEKLAAGVFSGRKGSLPWFLSEYWSRQTAQGNCEHGEHYQPNELTFNN